MGFTFAFKITAISSELRTLCSFCGREHARGIILNNEPSNQNHVGLEWLFSTWRIFGYSSPVLSISWANNESA